MGNKINKRDKSITRLLEPFKDQYDIDVSRQVISIDHLKFTHLDLPITDDIKNIGLYMKKQKKYIQCTVKKDGHFYKVHGKTIIIDGK